MERVEDPPSSSGEDSDNEILVDLPPIRPSSSSPEILVLNSASFDHLSDKASLVQSDKILRAEPAPALKKKVLEVEVGKKTKPLKLSRLNQITPSPSQADIGDLENDIPKKKSEPGLGPEVEDVKGKELRVVEPFRARSPSNVDNPSKSPSFIARHRSLSDKISGEIETSSDTDSNLGEKVKGGGKSGQMELETEESEEQTFKELWTEIRPHCRLDFFLPVNGKKLCHKVSRYYGLLWLKIICVIIVMVGLVFGISKIPFSRPMNGRYYDVWAVASLYSLMAVLTIVFSYGFWVLLYGFRKSVRILVVVLPALLYSSAFYFIMLANGIEPWWYGTEVFMYLVFFGVVVLCCIIMQRAVHQVGDKFLVLVGVPILVKIAIWVIYSYGVFPLYRSLSNSLFKSAIRILVHPILMFINQLICMVFVRAFQNTTPYLATGLVVASYVENTVFGRLMIVALDDDFSITFWTSLLIGLVELVFRVTFTRRIKLVDWVWRKICCLRCVGTKLDFELELELQAACMHYEMMIDNAGIIVITMLSWQFWPHRQVFNLAYGAFTESSLGRASSVGGIQLFVNVIIDLIALHVEKIQGIPSTRIIREEPYRIFAWTILCFTQGIILVLYVNRALPFSGFCTSFDPCSCTYGHDLRLFPSCFNSSLISNVTA